MIPDSVRTLTRTPIELLVAVSESLLIGDTVEQRLAPMFRRAKRLLHETALEDVLEDVFGVGTKSFTTMSKLVTHVDHVGLLVPSDLESHLADFARASGFVERHAWYPSVVVARELTAIAKVNVPTKLMKAFTAGDANSPAAGIEAFVPQAPSGDVAHWIQNGIARHMAVALSEPAFDRVTECFEAAGFHVPAFMEGRMIRNAAENISVMYYDTEVAGGLLRIECFHDARRAG
jgi:hypothetical protein